MRVWIKEGVSRRGFCIVVVVVIVEGRCEVVDGLRGDGREWFCFVDVRVLDGTGRVAM